MTWRDDLRNLTDHDRAEVEALRRFLRLHPKPPFITEEAQHPGWLPYVLGLGPAPPEGLDDVAVTAWTMPA